MERTKIQNDKMFMLQDEIYSDSIIPFFKKELKRKVNLFGKVTLNGGIYCQNLEIEAGDIYIQKSVYVDEGLLIKGTEGGQVWFKSPVNCEHSILIDKKSDIKVRFGKTIRSKSINLYNSIVYGNVIGESITLKNSVVLGGVFASNNLSIDDSIVGTYHCSELKHFNNMGILYPIAISDNRPELSEKIYMVVPGSFKKEDEGMLFKLSKDDFYPVTKDDRKKYIFSNTMRIFDLRVFYQSLQENIERLFLASSNDHDDIETMKVSCNEFDAKYFIFINKNFKLTRKRIWSDYTKINNEQLGKYINEKIKREAENHIIDEFNADEYESTYNMSNDAKNTSADYLNQNKRTKKEIIENNTDQTLNEKNPYDELNQGNNENQSTYASESDKSIINKDGHINTCPNCNSSLESEFMFCSECGEKIK